MINVWAIGGAVLASVIAEPLGRRSTFLTSATCFIAGSLVQAFASSYGWLLFGVSLVGLAVGLGLAIDPIYIAEISPAGRRGYFVTFSELTIAVGQTLGFVVALVISLIWPSWAGNWRVMIGLGAIVPGALVVAVVFVMPESPRWLAIHGREAEARSVLLDLGHSEPRADATLRAIAAEKSAAPLEDATLWGFLSGVAQLVRSSPTVRHILLVGIGTAVAQQMSGTDAIFYNYVASLRAIGVGKNWKIYATLVAFGVLKISVALISMRLLDTVGRRPLLVFSGFATSATAFALAVAFAFATDAKGHARIQVPVVALYFIYVASFEIGLGPGCWLIPSEIFYNSIRMRAMSLATFANRCATVGVVGTAIPIREAWSWSGYFAWFGSTCLVGATFLAVYLPETKGKSLEEMYAYFASLSKATSRTDLASAMLEPSASGGRGGKVV
mmetsp:Transcript_33754/g.103575  ORF Transcript_33754/g.103575 Transcript_33754/m.103575 type:complete len:443 (+) Transcript_33754:494-1822(+)